MTRRVLKELGVAVNYNAYGETIADLHVPPVDLAAEMLAYADPLDFARASAAFRRLADGFRKDMEQARRLEPWRQQAGAVVFVLPDAAWARRASGTLANDLAKAHAAQRGGDRVAEDGRRLSGLGARAARLDRVGGGVLPSLSDGRRAADSRGCEPPAGRRAGLVRGRVRDRVPRGVVTMTVVRSLFFGDFIQP